MSTCAFIFARGGSKGVPRKNIRILNGKPLIAYAIEVGIESSLIDRIVVSTDDEEIAKIAAEYGAEVPFLRPKELAEDDTPEIFAWKHAIKELSGKGAEMDIFVSLPPTAPLRSVSDVNKCIKAFIENDVDIVVTVKTASRHPAFNMVSIDAHGVASLLMPDYKEVFRRQDAPQVFDMTTVAYVAKPDFVLQTGAIFDGKVYGVKIPDERAIDIDTELDFDFASFLFSRDK